jgi:hypothetical protein
MEGIGFNQAPKFKSAEEEVAYLRAHIAEREKEMNQLGQNSDREKIAEQTLESYKVANAKEILHESAILPEHKVEQLVLELRPETHDRKMEELLGILLDKGIKNALEVIKRLDSPHLDDDFHRFLVQYLHATHGIPGLKEGMTPWNGVNMKLFEVTLPEQGKDESKGFKEFITAMEQFYAGMLNVGGTDNPLHKYYTLEIALSNEGRDIMFYAAVPTEKADLFEKQILGFYSNAKISEAKNDYNIFTPDGFAVGSYAKFAETQVFSLKTHDNIEHDPMNVIVNAFSKLKEKGEGAAIQFVIAPAGDSLVKKFSNILWRVKNEGIRAKEAFKLASSFDREAVKVLKDIFFTSAKEMKERKDKKEVNEKDVERVGEKIKSTILEASIRIVVSAETHQRAKDILREIESAFNQFSDPLSNSLEWERLEGGNARDFFHNFSFRLWEEKEMLALNLKELSTLFHFPIGVSSSPQLKQSKASTAPVPLEMKSEGIFLGTNEHRGEHKQVFMGREDRRRHFYAIGQTGTGKTTILKHMIIQDIKNGDGVCFIDPHGSDLQDIIANIPKERIDDVIYFDPAHTARPMGLNMLEYDINYPEQKTFVVNELLAIFNKLFDMKTAGGPAFEQYFRNSALLVMEDPSSGMTLLEIGRVLADKEFRDLKLSRCKNPIIKQFWQNAEQTSGEQSLANFVPYVTNKFDVFVSNDIMRPVIAQEKSVFNFRDIMDNKKILLVNLSKGRLGDINSNLIGLILVGKLTMAALSRVDILGKGEVNDFYLYIDEFQNVTTDSIATILSEARKYRLCLNIAHQYIEQLEDNIKNAVFGNVGSMAIHRVSVENAEIFAKQLEPTFNAQDIIKLENLNCYVKMLVNGMPVKPFNSKTPFPPKGNPELAEKIKELSYLKFGRDREEVEAEIMARYSEQFKS